MSQNIKTLPTQQIDYNAKYIDLFNSLIKQLRLIFKNESNKLLFDNIDTLSDEEKVSRGNKFVELFDNEKFELFINSKIKLFSHKSKDTQALSESLLLNSSGNATELNIKNILNKQPDDVKKIIWMKLHTIYLYIELCKDKEKQNEDNINKLSDILFSYTTNNIKELLDIDVNDATRELVNDLVKSLTNILKNQSNHKQLIKQIMEVNKKISEKYSGKIEKGEIEYGKLLQGLASALINKFPQISNLVPGIEKIIPDLGKFDFSNVNSETNKNVIKDIMKKLNLEDILKKFNLDGILGKLGKKQKKKEKVIIDENFSTANVEMDEVETEESSKGGMKIGSMLNIADKFGMLPGSKSNKTEEKEDNGFDLNNLFGNITDMMKDEKELQNLFGDNNPFKDPEFANILNTVSKLSKTESVEDKDKILADLEEKMHDKLSTVLDN